MAENMVVCENCGQKIPLTQCEDFEGCSHVNTALRNELSLVTDATPESGPTKIDKNRKPTVISHDRKCQRTGL